jgi:hypothetical protein
LCCVETNEKLGQGENNKFHIVCTFLALTKTHPRLTSITIDMKKPVFRSLPVNWLVANKTGFNRLQPVSKPIKFLMFYLLATKLFILYLSFLQEKKFSA